MFEDGLAGAVLVEQMTAAGVAESAAVAARLIAIGELDFLRARQWAERQLWCTDPYDAVAAEVSAALKISRSRAGGQVHQARILRDRLPEVRKVFAAGSIDHRVVGMIIARTETVSPEFIAVVDAALARRAVRWTRLSEPKLRDRVDQWIAKHDPAGVRVPPKTDDCRYVDIEATQPGMAGISGNIHAPDADAFDQRLDALAATVCDKDPRSTAQRRADAVGALGRAESSLRCECEREDCPVAAVKAQAAAVVIHVLAGQGTLDGSSDDPGYLQGFGILPAQSVRDLAASPLAKQKPLDVPGDDSEAQYRPSAGLARFVTWRHLTCCFPGCDEPVARCEVDHTVPYPKGPTHQGNTKPYCKTHHLLKTFYTGPGGWTDSQWPDGTVMFTAPSGHFYFSHAHGAVLFPALARADGATRPQAHSGGTDAERGRKMPLRRQTREQDRQDRITEERRERTEIIAEEERRHQQWRADTYEPPPF